MFGLKLTDIGREVSARTELDYRDLAKLIGVKPQLFKDVLEGNLALTRTVCRGLVQHVGRTESFWVSKNKDVVGKSGNF